MSPKCVKRERDEGIIVREVVDNGDSVISFLQRGVVSKKRIINKSDQ